jgi:hypothetical protein
MVGEAVRMSSCVGLLLSGAANPGCSRLSGGFFRQAQILSYGIAVSDPRAAPAQLPETLPEARF